MAFLGLITRREHEAEIAALKAEIMPNLHQWLLETAEAEKWVTADPHTFDEPLTLYRKLSWILQAVDNTAAAGALARFDVKRVVQDKEPKDIPNHPFETLLRNPNPLDSRYEFLYGTIAMYKLTGNAYWWLNRESPDAPPDEMWLIPSNMIIPVPDENMYLRGYYYYPGTGREMLLPPHEIIHFRRLNPFSRFVGLSAIESLAVISKGDLEMQKWNTNLFAKSNGMLPGILAFEQMVADPTWEKIKHDTREAQKNRSLLMLRGVGQGVASKGGVSWLQNNVSQKDMDFLEGRRMTAKEIMDTLAPGLYTWLSGESTYSNAGANRAAFNELTIYTMHVTMAEKITNGLLPTYGGRPLIGEFEDVRIADREMDIKEQERYAITHTIGEIRERDYGDEPLGDERDKLLPAQIKAESGGIQDPPPAPVVKPSEGAPQEQPAKESDIAPKGAGAGKSAVSLELLREVARFERFIRNRMTGAVKADGQKFTSGLIPAETMAYLDERIPSCENVVALKALFDGARERLGPLAPAKPAPDRDDTAIRTLAASIELAIKAAQEQENGIALYEAIKRMGEAKIPNIIMPAPVINMPPGEQYLHVNIPEQPAPQTHNHYAQTIEPAKPADVKVDSPVSIYQTVEPAPVPINNLTIENKIPEQPAPVTNLNIENKIPESPAPTFKADIIMPESPAPNVTFAPVIQPSEVVNQNNIEVKPADVKMPKIKRVKEKKQVERNAADNIDSTTATSEYEYEDE